VAVAACVLVPRTVLVSRAHTECWDDLAHLRQGLSLVMRTSVGGDRADPPLGQVLTALPMVATGCLPPRPENYQPAPDDPPGAAATYAAPVYGQKWSPETIRTMLAAWKALLVVPLAALVFHWCRALYGLGGGWLGMALLLVDPTVAGHVAPLALDLLGAETIVFACYFAWRYFERPTRGRLVAAGVSAMAAMLTKNTAAIVPAVFAVYAFLHWLRDRRVDAQSASFRRRFNQFLAGAVVAAAAFWPLTTFDFSRPRDHGPVVSTEYTENYSFTVDVVNGGLMHRWPGGVYIGSLALAYDKAGVGHPAYLLGHFSRHGWWYYFPVVAAYKVPVGTALVMLLGLVSLRWRRPGWGETPLIVAVVCWGTFIILSGVNIGFRHFLPVYVPMLMLSARCVVIPRLPRVVPWIGVALAAIHVGSYHPDYLSYVNWPREKPWLAISDSNIDWGQGLKQVRRWLDDHPEQTAGRTVWLGYFGNPEGRSVPYYLGNRARELQETDPAPTSGLLVVSPVWVAGVYGTEQYAFLRPVAPDAVIGHSMLVYDLDRIAADRENEPTPPNNLR
jgi:hypothetical protein